MCGIAGIVSKDVRPFDLSGFCVLGVTNDSRGGDSCGVFIDGKYEYGVDKLKMFADFYPTSKVLHETREAKISFVHCRKASVGEISERTAQPVVLKNNSGQIEYVLMHNGTVHNYKELAAKYIPDTDIAGLTDSQVMAHIFRKVGYAPLCEYIGGATFAIIDYRGTEPKVLLFRGASKKTADAEVAGERPLFYYIDPARKELIFSSMKYPVELILRGLIANTPTRQYATIAPVDTNTLLEFDGEKLTPVGTYDRSYATPPPPRHISLQ